MNSQDFTQLLVNSIDPTLSMYLMKESDQFAVYTGLWGTWELNDANLAAKVVYVTVLKASQQSVPRGPVSLDTLLPCVALQLHHIDQENPAWEASRAVLSDEFQRLLNNRSPGISRSKLQFQSTSENLSVRKFKEPSQLAAFAMRQATAEDPTVARPSDVLNRRRVAYLVEGVMGVRVYVEKSTAKQPLQNSMEAEAGLVRTGTVLGAINEWKTWFVVDDL